MNMTETEKQLLTKENLIWFSGVMDQLRLLNKTLDLNYKPKLSNEQLILKGCISDKLMDMEMKGEKLPTELGDIVRRHYPAI